MWKEMVLKQKTMISDGLWCRSLGGATHVESDGLEAENDDM